MLEENNIHVVSVPANGTDPLQLMDLSINKSVKEFMRGKFRDWFSEQVQDQLSVGKEITPVDLKMPTMKPLGARWLISLYDYITENKSIVENGFKAAGLLGCCSVMPKSNLPSRFYHSFLVSVLIHTLHILNNT